MSIDKVDMVKKRILVFSDYFIPGFKAGGPIKSILNLTKAIQDDYEVLVVTRNKDFGVENVYSNVIINKFTKVFGFKVIYTDQINFNRIYSIISLFNPHVIHLNSYFSIFTFLVLVLKKIKFIKTKIILSPRGELLQNALKIKYFKKKLFMKCCKFINFHNDIAFHSTSDEEASVISNYHKNKVYSLPNLASIVKESKLPIIKQSKYLRIIFISRIRDNKNLLFAIEILKNFPENDIVFDIYGPIEDAKYWAKCLKAISNLPPNVKSKYCGVVKSTDVKKIMSKYQVLFLPTKTENFGHVIVEAMQVGLIPLISNETPWNDLQENNAGWALSLDNKEEFINVIKSICHYNRQNIQSLSQNVRKYIKKKLNNSETIKRYKEMYNDII